MASESPQFLQSPFTGHGLNNYIARATSPRTPSTSRTRLTRTQSEEPRPGTSALYYKWSKSSPKTPKTPKISKGWEGRGNDMEEVEQARLRAQLPRSMVSPKPLSLLGINVGTKQKDGLLPRRKRDLTGLSLETMTTVQEYTLDSPTIPGRPPTRQTLRESPKDSPRSSRWGRGSLTPRATMVQNRRPEFVEYEQNATPSSDSEAGDVSETKPFSAPLPKALAPLKIPSSQYTLPPEAYKPASPMQIRTPPQVPPKSPRTMSRASPHSRSSPVSASSSTSTLHTANSSTISLSPAEDPTLSSKPWSAPPRGFSPQKNPRDFTPTSAGSPSPLPWVLKPMSSSPSKHTRGGMSIDSRSAPPKTPTAFRSGSVPTIPVHSIPSLNIMHANVQENAWDASLINRGRPTRRCDLSLQRNLSRSIKNAISIGENFSELPVGLHRMVAMDVMSPEELRSLTRGAELKATTYEVLYESHVSNLSHELHLLDDRCEYLRRTYTSLKEGRRGLHERMLTYLSGWQSVPFSCENMMKQELAISELDASIEEWRSKLERADERRNQIQIKLLEHTAAVQTLNFPGSPRRFTTHEEQTPPRSPERADRSFSTERRDVESIRVYADSGVAELLASIEQEIVLIERGPEM